MKLTDEQCQEVEKLYRLNELGFLWRRELPEYGVWHDMKARCYNPNKEFYYLYGGKGVTVCEEWREDFRAFFRYVGRRPVVPGFCISLDRYPDEYGNYEPGNVRWATASEQMVNRRAFDHKGENGSNVKLNWEIVREIRALWWSD